MTKATYKGPGDSVTIDGLVLEKGASADLTPEQVNRLRQDPETVLEVDANAQDTPEERDRIAKQQDKARDSAVKAAEKPKAESGRKGDKA